MNVYGLETLLFSILDKELLLNEFNNEDYIISTNKYDYSKVAEIFNKVESRSLWYYKIDTENEMIKKEAEEKRDKPTIVYSFVSSSYNDIKVLNRTSNCVLKVKEFKELSKKLSDILKECS